MNTDKYPHSKDLEEAILSLAILDYKHYLSDAILEPEDFYIEKNGFVWAAILHLRQKGVNIDIVSIEEELSDMGKLADFGGPAALTSLMLNLTGNFVDGENAEHIVEDLREYRARRDALKISQKLAMAAFDLRNNMDVTPIAEQLKMLRWREDANGFRDLSQVSEQLTKTIDAGFTAISTGIPELDAVLEGGLFGNSLYVSAGRPSAGKTAIWWQVAQNIAMSKMFSQPRVLFFSLEMTAEELLARRACGIVGISWNAIRSGKKADGTAVTQQEKDSVKQTAETIAQQLGQRLIIVDEPCNVWDICRMIDFHQPDVVIIDHLNEIKRHDKTDKIEWFGAACKILRDKAKQKHVPVVLLHQLSRAAEAKTIDDDRAPVLSDLKWSGEIEERADVILMLHRPDRLKIMMKPTMSQLDIWVRKYRNGTPNTKAELAFDLAKQWFTSIRRLP